MSSSPKSKPASPDSPRDGAEPDSPPKVRSSKSRDSAEVELELSRQRLIGWTGFGVLVGLLMIFKLGTVGQWVGVVLVALGLYRGYQLLQSYLHPPGTIIVKSDEVTLPRGICMPRPLKVSRGDITAVYFLRRSVPWNHSSPVLVIEVGPKALAYPRDWFASEADQRQIVHALLHDKKAASSSAASETTEEAAASSPT